MMNEVRNRIVSASFGTLVGSSLSILSFLLIAKSLGTDKLGVLGLHFVISGLLLNFISFRAELIIPRLSEEISLKFAKQVIVGAVLMFPVIVVVNYCIYYFILGIKSYHLIPYLTALHTVAFVVFSVFNACNVNQGNLLRVICSYVLQGGFYLLFTALLSFSSSNNLELYIIAHVASFIIYPAVCNLRSSLHIFQEARVHLSFSEIFKQKKTIIPLVIQGLIHAWSIALLYFGVNLAGGQSAVGIFTIAHKVLTFPLRAISLPLLQALTWAFSKQLIKKQIIYNITFGICLLGVAFKVFLATVDFHSYFGPEIGLILDSVENLFLWWLAAVVALPAIGSTISKGDARVYTIFETSIFFSRVLGISLVMLMEITPSLFIEITSAIYFCIAFIFLIGAKFQTEANKGET